MSSYERSVYVAQGQKGHAGWVDGTGKSWDMPERITSILDRFGRSTVPNSQRLMTYAEPASQLDAVHHPHMVRAQREASLEAVRQGGPVSTVFDKGESGSSLIYPETFDLTMRSFRAAVAAAQSLEPNVRDGSALSVALSRPPGHHAGRRYYHGFCFANNAAGAAYTLRQNNEKVAIIDIDVHHGDGTQDIFYDDPSVFYTSLHADLPNPSPSTGHADETGSGYGDGANLNFPFEVGISAAKYSELFAAACESVVRFNPDALVVSAGFDGHKGEFTNLPPITQLEDQHYYALGQTLGALKLPTCVVLEGGYNLDTLADATEAFVSGIEQGMGKV